MTRLASILRGMAQRGGTTLMILAVALVATAAAATGPIYYQAARTSILRGTVASATFIGRGYEANETGAVAGLLGQVAPVTAGQLARSLGPLAGRGLFAPPVYSVETTMPYPQYRTSVPLIWRSDVCAHLRLAGRCPARRGQVLVSQRMAALSGWHAGQQVRFPGWPAFTITGIYRMPDQALGYWFGRGSLYFSGTSVIDAFFTPRVTLEQGPAQQQGTAVVDDLLRGSRVTGDDVGQLQSAMTTFSTSQLLQDQQVLVSTGIPVTLQAVQASWRSVAVPVLLITAQLLVACLLLLFLSVSDAVDARSHEVALAKLRGRGGWRTVVFGMSEPVLLLLVALPIGTLIGWAATDVLGWLLLRPGYRGDADPARAGRRRRWPPRAGWPRQPGRAADPAPPGARRVAPVRAPGRPTAAGWPTPSWPPAPWPGCSTCGDRARSARPAVACSACWCPACSGWPSRSWPPACCRWPAGPFSAAPAGAAGSAYFWPLRQMARRPGGVRTTMVLATPSRWPRSRSPPGPWAGTTSVSSRPPRSGAGRGRCQRPAGARTWPRSSTGPTPAAARPRPWTGTPAWAAGPPARDTRRGPAAVRAHRLLAAGFSPAAAAPR